MEKEYYIFINGEKVSVDEEIYRAYYQPVWREAKQKSVRYEMEYSLEILTEEGYEIADSDNVENIVSDKFLLDELYLALTNEERNIIEEIYFKNKTERELACILGISQPAVHKKRNKILEKIKNSQN